MKRIAKISLFVTFIILLINISGCSKKEVVDPFAKIGRTTYSMDDFHAFEQVRYYYPINKKTVFPGTKSIPTLFVETHALLPEAKKYKSQVLSGLQWKWKNIYFPGQFYLRKVIMQNLGYTDDELKGYYDQHKTEYVMLDSSKATTFDGLKPTVIKDMFLSLNPIDSTFGDRFPGKTGKALENQWFDDQKKNIVNIYINKYFKKEYGKDFPKDPNELFGDGKLITQKDLDIILEWVDDAKKEKAQKDESARGQLIKYMVTWKLFADIAQEKGYTKTAKFKMMKDMYVHYELVYHYLNKVVSQTVKGGSPSSKENFIYSYWDKRKKTDSISVDNSLIKEKYNEVEKALAKSAIDKFIAEKRNAIGVEFLQKGYVDNRDKSAKEFFVEADSVILTGNLERARRIYGLLSKDYLYTKEGKESFRELAKMYSDEGQYNKAVESYRNFILYNGAKEDWCKVYFMIAFTYGEKLNNYELAASNYRWILENTPDCDLSNDAEFMYLHLGEPLADVDEIRKENLRQGKSIN